MNLIGLDQIQTGNRLNIMIDRATCYYMNFFYIFFLRFVKTRVECSFETPSLIVKSFKIITRSEMFVAAYQSPGFRYELFNTGYLDGDNLPIHET